MRTRYVRVWRLEDGLGAGIWHNEARGEAMDALTARIGREGARRFNPSKHPGPSLAQSDFIDGEGREFKVFGVVTLAKVGAWFHCEFRRALAEAAPKVRLNLYRVPETHAVVDSWQAVFDRRAALLLESRKPDFNCGLGGRRMSRSLPITKA
jgi:hypothetical protein